MPTFGRIAITSIHPVVAAKELHLSPSSVWVEGPLPLALAGGPDDDSRSVAADAATRSTYHQDHTAAALVTRWHRWLGDDHDTPKRGAPWAVEVIKSPRAEPPAAQRRYVVVLHSTVMASDARWPADTLDVHDWELVLDVLGPVARNSALRVERVKGRPSSYHLRFVTPSAQHESWPSLGAASAGIEPRHEWLWMLASGTVGHFAPPWTAADHVPPGVREFAPAPEILMEEVVPAAITMSGDWSALVLRDGAAFIGMRADRGGVTEDSVKNWEIGSPSRGRSDSFYDDAELYVRTIYADTFVMGELQRWAMSDLAAMSHFAVTAGSNAVRNAREVQRRLLWLRRALWWTTSSAGGVADNLLGAYQTQHRMTSRLAQCVDDVDDLAVLAGREAEIRLGGALAFLTAVGVPFGGALAIGQLMQPTYQSLSDRVGTVVLCLLGGTALTGVLLSCFQGLRHALMDGLRRR